MRNKMVQSLNQWKCRQMCGKCSQIHPVHSLFVCYKKWLVFTEESIHYKFQLIIGCPLMQITICWCVQSFKISVDVAKCVEIFTNSQSTLTFCWVQKWHVWLNSIMERFQLIWSPLMLSTVVSVQHQCRRRQMGGKQILHWCWVTEHICSLLLARGNYLSWHEQLFMARFQLISQVLLC